MKNHLHKHIQNHPVKGLFNDEKEGGGEGHKFGEIFMNNVATAYTASTQGMWAFCSGCEGAAKDVSVYVLNAFRIISCIIMLSSEPNMSKIGCSLSESKILVNLTFVGFCQGVLFWFIILNIINIVISIFLRRLLRHRVQGRTQFLRLHVLPKISGIILGGKIFQLFEDSDSWLNQIGLDLGGGGGEKEKSSKKKKHHHHGEGKHNELEPYYTTDDEEEEDHDHDHDYSYHYNPHSLYKNIYGVGIYDYPSSRSIPNNNSNTSMNLRDDDYNNDDGSEVKGGILLFSDPEDEEEYSDV